MKVVILAAGRGTRMGHLTDDCPKPMLPIKGRPKLAYTVETLPRKIDEVILVIGYLGEQIRAFFGDVYDGKKISYVEQEDFNGTGGAVMLVKNLIAPGEKFLVIMGDDLYQTEDLEKMLRYESALLAMRSHHVTKCALVDVDEDHYLRGVIEVPHGHAEGYVNTAAYMLTSDFFDTPLTAKQEGSAEYGLPQMMTANVEKCPVRVMIATQWMPIGNSEALKLAQREIENFI